MHLIFAAFASQHGEIFSIIYASAKQLIPNIKSISKNITIS